MARIEMVDSVMFLNVAKAGVTEAEMQVFNEPDSLFISFESESVDANIVFTEKRTFRLRSGYGWY